MNFWPYWGKAAQAVDGGPDHHLLVYHSLDVAAVGRVLVSRHHRFRTTVASILGIPEDDLAAWMVWFLAAHDVGKFAGPFQNQRPDLVNRLGGEASSKPYTVRHDSAGWALWQSSIRSLCIEALGLPGKSGGWLDVWARCVTGHHGQPPTNQVGVRRVRAHEEFSPTAIGAAADWVSAISNILPHPTCPNGDWSQMRRRAELGSWWIAGAGVLADWLGSNTSWFPYEAQRLDLSTYWPRAIAQAERAVEESRILPVATTTMQRFDDLWPGWSPTPVQSYAEQIDVGRPLCAVVEDVMGAGKTEAALLLAHRLIAAGQAEGLFWGLPTMATANALLPRLQGAAGRLFQSTPTVTLAHSQRRLVEFLSNDEDDQSASERASNWLSDDNRRALLSQVGVGTIDQALLSALHSRHNCLRLLGLLGKVLVVDEVHACDTYMRGVLCVLLELHARVGGSVILLSATLPRAQRQELVDAWRRGRGGTRIELQRAEYPLLTCITDGGQSEWPLATRPSLRRHVSVEHVEHDSAAIACVLEAAGCGQCAVWIRNTVRDAADAYSSLRASLGDRVELFHARFALGDRLSIERRVLARFGKDSTPLQRAGRVLIATQVVEQSIDLDFDLMVTDLAPIDLMLQRAGRLQRHARDRRPAPLLVVNGPSPSLQTDASWLRATMPGTSFVYENHGRLWLGLRELLAKKQFETPESARTLVDTVYDAGSEACMPEALRQIHRKAEAIAKVAGATGRANAIRPSGSYEVDGPDWWRDELTPTRLGDPSITIALGVWDGLSLTPLHSGPIGWALSSVAVRASSFGLPDNPQTPISAESISAIGRWRHLLVLERRDGELAGHAVRGRNERVRVTYSTEAGLHWEGS
jgi:CRISPR-associated endonuclease/helicase Cas3